MATCPRWRPCWKRLNASNLDVVICGHTHMQFDRTLDGVRIINAGSVGVPYGEPGAYWAMLGPDVQLRRTDYDREAAARRIRQLSWPNASKFAPDSVLKVPTVQEATGFLSQAESQQISAIARERWPLRYRGRSRRDAVSCV